MNGFGWLNVLAAPLLGLRMAEGDGGGAGGTDGGEATPTAAEVAAQRPTSEPQGGETMTMGGKLYTAEEIRQATEQVTQAKPGEGGTAKAGDPAKTADPAKDGFIPRERYNEAVQRKDAMLRAAGIDPETGAPLAKGADTTTAAKPKEFAKGEEPWAKDLVPLPRADDVDAQGNPKYADTASFLEALADAKANNRVVEALGRRKLDEDAAAAERQRTSQAERDQQTLKKFANETIPAALVKRGLIAEGALPQEVGAALDTALAPLAALPAMERQSTYLYNFAMKNSQSGADLLLAVAEEAKTREGQAYILKLGAMDDNALIRELIAMDRLVSLGLTIQGKARPAAAPGAAKGGLTPQKGEGIPRTMTPSPTNGSSGEAVDVSQLTGEALFKQLEAETKAKNESVLKRIGNRN